MNLLSLDPALACGYRCSRTGGVWHLAGPQGEHPGARLLRLYQRLVAANKAWGPFTDIVAEEAASGSKGRDTALFHAEILGVIKLAASVIRATVHTYHNATIKAFACKGNAKKHDMLAAYRRHFGETAQDDNEADARFLWLLAKQDARRGWVDSVEERKKAKHRERAAKKRRAKVEQLPLFAGRGA